MIGFFGFSTSMVQKLIVHSLPHKPSFTIVLFPNLRKLVLDQVVYLFQAWIALDLLFRIICLLLTLRPLGRALGYAMSSSAKHESKRNRRPEARYADMVSTSQPRCKNEATS